MKLVVRLIALLSAVGFAGAQPVAAASGRTVEIRWDFRQSPGSQLQIWVDCRRAGDEGISSCKKGVTVIAPEAYHFELRRGDRVTLLAIDVKSDDEGDPEYVITGTNLDEKDLDQLKKLFTGAGAATAPRDFGAQGAVGETPPYYYPKAVTDKLIPGGKLTAVFNKKKKENAGKEVKETITKTSGSLTFNIQPNSPRITVSGGLGFTTAAGPAVALVKTSTIVSFTKDGAAQQAYQQVIALRDADTKIKPVQSLVTQANFQLYKRAYVSAGLRIDEKIFDQPMIGVTYRHPLGDRIGLNFTLGTVFSREVEIVAESGFAAGQLVDPTIGLTVEDIPTRSRYHKRLALIFSIDF